MKNPITTFLVIGFVVQSNAQQVIGSAGKNLSAAGVSVNFTLGESFAKSYSAGSTDLSTGFHQNFLKDSCAVSVSIATSNSSCAQPTGTATAVATGGLLPYTYQWTNGDITTIADSLMAGIYQVLVSDAAGCKHSAIAVVNDAGAPAVTVSSVTHVSCKGWNNGAININVSGGLQPYSYHWVNGASTQNISGLYAGPYEVEITDANGCKSAKSILVNEPLPVSLVVNTTNAACGNADGSAEVTASGGSGSYAYQWSNGSSTSAITALAAGNYSILVTDSKGCTANLQASVLNTGGALITIDSVQSAGCGKSAGVVYISVTGGAMPYTYMWSNGTTAEDLTGISPGVYGLVVTGSDGCKGALTVTLPSKPGFSPSICMVTVDTATGTNQCVFEKDAAANSGISQYNIYRETSSFGVYQLMGNVSSSQLSVWTDPGANPMQRSWRYKISAVDTCGTESPLSPLHKTIHLTANPGLGNVVNLIWDNYEGFSYGTYSIYRYTPATGWDSLTSLPGNPSVTYNSYTDLSPPGFVNLHYFIQVEHPTGCSPTIINDPFPFAAINTTRSNTFRIDTTSSSVEEYNAELQMFIYPNPNTGQFSVHSPQAKLRQITVYDMFGRRVFERPSNLQLETFNLQLPSGIYQLKAETEKGGVNRKIIIQ